MAAMKTKIELKDVFSGPSSFMYQSGNIDLGGSSIQLSPELDVPVKVLSLSIEQGEPSITHYKVIGLDGDWDSTAEIGDFAISVTIPTKHTDVLKWAFGEDAVKDGVSATLNGATYTGQALTPKKHKITGTFIIEDEEKENLMILSGVALWARQLLDENGTVYAIALNGTLEVGANPSIAWLKKGAAGA